MDHPSVAPFVLPVDDRVAHRDGIVDLYLPDEPDGSGVPTPRPAVVFVHGGPIDPAFPLAREWPLYQGYGRAAAQRGVVGAMVDLRLTRFTELEPAAEDLATAVDLVRADPRVDPDRLAIWAFSGGGLLTADWLRRPPAYLRCVALNYPVLAPLPWLPAIARFRPIDALAGAGDLPIVLIRAGRDRDDIARTQADFVTAARERGARLDIIDVPDGQHAFDIVDDTDQSRAAITTSLDTVFATLR
jgi:dienelactone hydrolase